MKSVNFGQKLDFPVEISLFSLITKFPKTKSDLNCKSNDQSIILNQISGNEFHRLVTPEVDISRSNFFTKFRKKVEFLKFFLEILKHIHIYFEFYSKFRKKFYVSKKV